MPRRLRSVVVGATCLLATTWGAPAGPVVAPVDTASSLSFADLPGIADDDLSAALETFRASCAALTRAVAPTRPAAEAPAGLRSACAAMPPAGTPSAGARAFFEAHFVPRRVDGNAFFTGYYEPAVAGSLTPTKAFATPLLAPPADLVAVPPGTVPGIDPQLTSARRLSSGRIEALPDRAAIEAGRLGAEARPLAYVASPVEAFFIHVQGSARLRLPDGSLRRLVYAGRNGYPYTSIGKLLVQRLNIPPSEMGMTQLRAWIERNGQHPGESGVRLMQENRSFIFFRFDDTLAPDAGPIGGQGISLTPLRSLAIDRTFWPYGLPFFIDTALPEGLPLRRLMIAQDTGAAIRGRARADIFFGTGMEAGAWAGVLRQTGTLYALWPRPPAEAPPNGGAPSP